MPLRLLAALALLAPSLALAQPSPYAGQETREVKALSTAEVGDLLAGRGMGLAKAAELNSYPGPAHVLALAAELGLSGEQLSGVRDIEARMTRDARTVGAAIIDGERTVDRAFSEGRADATSVGEATLGIGRLQGRLRAIHLIAHVETRAILTGDQVRRYDALRGYDAHSGHGNYDAGGRPHRRRGHGG